MSDRLLGEEGGREEMVKREGGRDKGESLQVKRKVFMQSRLWLLGLIVYSLLSTHNGSIVQSCLEFILITC